MATIHDKLTAIANAIRTKTGGTGKLSLDAMASDLNSIPERTSSDLTASGATVTVPAGNYKSQATKSVATATQATPSISVDSAGKITASATQTAGYVSAGTKSATKQLTTKAAATITPKTTNQTIAAGTYLTGVQTIAGDADLVAANIVSGKNIFGVAGSHTCDSNVLNFKVVGGTSQPSNPVANTIWVNTSTTISSWIFQSTQPSGTSGRVWIKTASSSSAPFNALKSNSLYTYPIAAYQYSGSAWVTKTAKIYQSGSWKSWTLTVVPNSSSYPNTAWTTYSSSTDSGYQPSITVSSSSAVMKFSVYKNSGSNRIYVPVDVTGYTKMTIAGNYVAPNNAYGTDFSMNIGMYASATGSLAAGYTNRTTKDDTTVTISETSYDISSLTGTYYFEAHVINNASSSSYTVNPTLTLTKVLFE